MVFWWDMIADSDDVSTIGYWLFFKNLVQKLDLFMYLGRAHTPLGYMLLAAQIVLHAKSKRKWTRKNKIIWKSYFKRVCLLHLIMPEGGGHTSLRCTHTHAWPQKCKQKLFLWKWTRIAIIVIMGRKVPVFKKNGHLLLQIQSYL